MANQNETSGVRRLDIESTTDFKPVVKVIEGRAYTSQGDINLSVWVGNIGQIQTGSIILPISGSDTAHTQLIPRLGASPVEAEQASMVNDSAIGATATVPINEGVDGLEKIILVNNKPTEGLPKGGLVYDYLEPDGQGYYPMTPKEAVSLCIAKGLEAVQSHDKLIVIPIDFGVEEGVMLPEDVIESILQGARIYLKDHYIENLDQRLQLALVGNPVGDFGEYADHLYQLIMGVLPRIQTYIDIEHYDSLERQGMSRETVDKWHERIAINLKTDSSIYPNIFTEELIRVISGFAAHRPDVESGLSWWIRELGLTTPQQVEEFVGWPLSEHTRNRLRQLVEKMRNLRVQENKIISKEIRADLDRRLQGRDPHEFLADLLSKIGEESLRVDKNDD